MNTLIVYSKYSKHCQKFIKTLENSDIIDYNKLTKLCIDNPTIREAFVKHTNIKQVPIIIYSDVIYEGSHVYKWLNEISNTVMLRRKQIEEEQQQQQQEQAAIKTEKKIKNESEPKIKFRWPHQDKITNIDGENEEDSKENEKPQLQDKITKYAMKIESERNEELRNYFPRS